MDFDIAEPTTLADALDLLSASDPSVRPLGGATALMVMIKAGVFQPTRLVSLRSVAGLSHITEAADGTIHIGGLATLSMLEHSRLVRERLPVITDALRRLANVRVRNVATVGGNLAHGDPHMDLPPVLMALGASVTVRGQGGERRFPVSDLFTGYMETCLGLDELIIGIDIPPLRGAAAHYTKITTRSAHDWPVLGIAVCGSIVDGAVHELRLVVSGATERPVHIPAALVNPMLGKRPREAELRSFAVGVAASLTLLADAHGSAEYKKHLLAVHLRRILAGFLGGQHNRERAH